MVKAGEHSLKFSENLFTQYSIPNDRILGQGKLIVVFLLPANFHLLNTALLRRGTLHLTC